MKTLKINNNHYQECDVVILSSKTQQFDNYLVLNKEQKLCVWNTSTMGSQKSLDIQHLYILSNDEIKEGDWFITQKGNLYRCNTRNSKTIYYVSNSGGMACKVEYCKKIIATTYEYLGCSNTSISHLFAQIPQSFIEHYIREYNKGNVISKVLVEVENDYEEPQGDYFRIKLSQNNEISILTEQKQETLEDFIKKHAITEQQLIDGYKQGLELSIEKLEMFSREEIITDIEKAIIEGLDLGQYRDSWIQ
jgi:hypothetical protein